MKLAVEAISDELKFYLNQLQEYVIVLGTDGVNFDTSPQFKICFANSYSISHSIFNNHLPNINLFQAFPDLMLNDLPEKLLNVLASGKQTSIDHSIDYNNNEYWLNTKIVKISDTHLLTFSENITAKKNNENYKDEMSQMLNEAHRILKMNCWELDLQTKLIHSNSDFSKIFEFDTKRFEISLDEYYDLLLPESVNEAKQILHKNILNGTPFVIERAFITPKGNSK
ncbi:MAG: hypothetical protein RI955_1663 [Bacteroidota bacterium]